MLQRSHEESKKTTHRVGKKNLQITYLIRDLSLENINNLQFNNKKTTQLKLDKAS